VVVRTAQPYLQVVLDTRIPGMADDRTAIIGDARSRPGRTPPAERPRPPPPTWALYEHLAVSDGNYGCREAVGTGSA
jgi:hypothetical protein